MKVLALIALIAAAPAAAMTQADCARDLAALEAVLPVAKGDIVLADRPTGDGWCQIGQAVEELQGVEWSTALHEGGFSLSLRRAGIGMGALGEMGLQLSAHYDDAAKEVRLSPIELQRADGMGLVVTARLARVDLSTPALAQMSLGAMELAGAELTVEGDADFIARMAAEIYGFDMEAARRNLVVAGDQRKAMQRWLDTTLPDGVLDDRSFAAFRAFIRDYPTRGGRAVITLPPDPPFPAGLAYRALIFGEVPAGTPETLFGIYRLDFRWYSGG